MEVLSNRGENMKNCLEPACEALKGKISVIVFLCYFFNEWTETQQLKKSYAYSK